MVETEPPRHCIVSPDTLIDMEEEPLERSAEEVPYPPPAKLAPTSRPHLARPLPPAAACRRLLPPRGLAREDT